MAASAPRTRNVFPFVPPEGITVSELAELARVRKQTMAEAVEQLERMGYVERQPKPRDRRSRLVFLTERGGPRRAGGRRQLCGRPRRLYVTSRSFPSADRAFSATSPPAACSHA